MKKLVLLVVLVVGVAFFTGCKGGADVIQTQPDKDSVESENGKTEETVTDIEVEIKEIKPFKYVCVEGKGSYATIESVIGTLWTEVGKRQIKPAGMMFGIYYDDPCTTPEKDWKWEMGVPVAEDVKVNEPLKVKDWTHTKVASYVYTGSYDKVGTAYQALYAKVAKMGYVPAGPSRSIYLNDPNKVKPEELMTEITVAISKPEK